MTQTKISQLTTGVPKGTDETPATDTTDTTQAASGTTKKYIRSDELNFYLHSQGLTTYSAVRVASTVALTVTYNNGTAGQGATLTNAGVQAAIAIDGVTLALNDRVLVKNQASTFQNGIYTVTTLGTASSNWVLTRATDYDQAAEIFQYAVVLSDQGTLNAGLLWQETAAGPFVIGTSPIVFAQFTVQSLTIPVSLAQGGTSASLTASNGGIFYSTATAGAILAGTATANQILLSGSSTAPAWSTATYPSTTTINQLLYSSAANTIVGLATANSATLITSAGGVPSLSQTLPTAVQSNITQLGTQSQALNMGTHLINNVIDPVSAQDAATKAYVDAAIIGLQIQASCVAASTVALTVTYANGASGQGATLTNAGALAAFSLDGLSPTVGQRVLIKNQASTLQNGIYTVTTVGSGAVAWVLTRATDYDTPAEIQPGDWVPIDSGGTVNGATSWLQTATVSTIGVDAITFIQFTASLPISPTNGGTGVNNGTSTITIGGNVAFSGAFTFAGTLTGNTAVTFPTSGTLSTTTGTVTSVATAGLATGGPITTTGTVTVTAAVQADMETATSTTTAVTPGVVQYHPGIVKASVYYVAVAGAPSIVSSYNITSVTDTGAGILDFNLTTAFSNANNMAGMFASDSAPSATFTPNYISVNTSASVWTCLQYNTVVPATPVLIDTVGGYGHITGDQ